MRRTRLVASLAVASAASASLLFAAPALAYPPTSCTAISANHLHAGQRGTLRGCDFQNGEKVNGYAHSVTVFLGSTVASANGEATLSFVLPSDFPAGDHVAELVGQTSGRTVSAPFTVSASGSTGAAPSSSGSSLPFTGSNDIWQMTLAGVLLVGVGGSLLVVRRRRSHSAAA